MNADNLIQSDLTFYSDDETPQLEWGGKHYANFVGIYKSHITYRQIHSEDGVIDEGELKYPSDFDNEEFLNELDASIVSFDFLLKIVHLVETETETHYIWSLS